MIHSGGGGPASQAAAKWLSTKHTWTLNHLAKAWPLPSLAAARPKPAPVTTVTTTAVTTKTATAAVLFDRTASVRQLGGGAAGTGRAAGVVAGAVNGRHKIRLIYIICLAEFS